MASENLKKVVLLITKTVANGEQVFKDGFQFQDIFAFIPELSALPEIIKQKQALADELKALDSAAMKDLATYIETNLVLENKNTEEIIEAVIEVAVAGFNLFAKIKAIKPASVPIPDTEGLPPIA